MPRSIRCHCGGKPSCKLCNGTQAYIYEVGPKGMLPFRCPTCGGQGWLIEPDLQREKCFTCNSNGTVDPADPPKHGIFDIIWKAMFGA